MNRIIAHLGLACAFLAGCASLGKQRRGSVLRDLHVSIAEAMISSAEDCIRLKVRIVNEGASPIYLLGSSELPVVSSEAPQHAQPYIRLSYAIYEYDRYAIHGPRFELMEMRSTGEVALNIDIPLPLQDRYKAIRPGPLEALGLEPIRPRGSHVESVSLPMSVRVAVGAISVRKIDDSYGSTRMVDSWALKLQDIVESENVYIDSTSSPHRPFSCRDVVTGGGRRVVFTEWEFR